jgi:hypothetical protein
MTADMDEKQPLVGDAEKGSISKHEGGPGSSIPLLMQQYKIPLIILYYGLCSSTLIVINKVAVHNITVRQPRTAVSTTICWQPSAVPARAAAAAAPAVPFTKPKPVMFGLHAVIF